MEAAAFLVLGTLLFLLALSPILALLALVRVSRLERRMDALVARGPGTAPERPTPQEALPPPPSPAPASPPPPVAPPVSAPPVPSRAPAADFATSLGPRILVGAGGLAVVVFLGFFVRYAWENDWVGPSGRVLMGSLFSLGLVAVGLRLLDREYRPLGQGLAAAGFAGLYVSAYAAHGVYGLVPRGLAGLVMVAVTVCAVAVADRRDTRLLATLAWLGAYLVPVLLSTGEDRAVSLFAYLFLLGVGATWLDRRRTWPETLPLALAGTLLLYGAWCAAHFRPQRFGVAAVGLVLLSGLFVLGSRWARERPALVPGAALLAGGMASVAFANGADRPVALLLLLSAQAGLAAFLRGRWAWAETAGVSLGALAVSAWYGRWFQRDHAADALVLALVVSGAYVCLLAVRALLRARPLGTPDAATQVVAAGLAWVILDRVLGLTTPDARGPAAVGLAALHLVLGLAARRQGPSQLLWTRVTLALAALFLTLAVPVQLGLFGITLAWAGEALALLWVGTSHDSRLARAGGYAVLALAVGRLLVRHLPLHSGAFTPVVNPTFGTWLLVVAAVAAAWRMTAPERERGELLDHAAGFVLPPLGLALLFGLLTAETNAVFAERARQARAAGQAEAALLARRQGGLALSVLWTVLATALLGAGLALRSRGLFYAAYGLFAVTAFKVVMIDLATMPTLFRMLSFLALGVLLLAGAWLNLRFRERLPAPGGGP